MIPRPFILSPNKVACSFSQSHRFPVSLWVSLISCMPFTILISLLPESDICLNLCWSSFALGFMNNETQMTYNTEPARNNASILTLNIARTIPKTMRLKKENRIERLADVRNSSILLLSSTLWSISPVSFVSKKAIGNDISFCRQPETIATLTLVPMCRSSHPRMNSTDILPITRASWANRIRYINPKSLLLRPISIIDWVRKGMINWIQLPINRPSSSWNRYLSYSLKYLKRNLKPLDFSCSLSFSKSEGVGSIMRTNPEGLPSAIVDVQFLMNSSRSYLTIPMAGSDAHILLFFILYTTIK